MPKIEELLGQKPPKMIRDSVGNELLNGDLVTVLFNRPPVFRVIAAQTGGIATPNGPTPATVRLICDITVGCRSGDWMGSLLKVVNPQSEAAVSKIMDNEPRG